MCQLDKYQSVICRSDKHRSDINWSDIHWSDIHRSDKSQSSFMMKKKRNFFTMSFNVGLSTRGSVRSNLMRSLFSKTEKSDYERKNIQLKLKIDALKSLKNC
jgi:hypothetical protein